MGNIKVIIFDLDGTLIDAYQAISRSLNFTLDKCGLPKQSDLKIRRAVGWGDRELIKAFVADKEVGKALRIYRRHHKISLSKYARLIPGALEVLDFLDKKGYKLAVATNRPMIFTNIVLRHLKIKKYFDYVLCADRALRAKPCPDMLNKVLKKFSIEKKQAFYVGDMAIDALFARKAGVRAVIARGGSSTLKEIKKEKPFKIIKSLSFLCKVISV